MKKPIEIDAGLNFCVRLDDFDNDQKPEDFRQLYLKALDKQEAWDQKDPYIVFDFKHVDVISPSFANKVFAYFRKYASAEDILKRITFKNITDIKEMIIKLEVCSGYNYNEVDSKDKDKDLKKQKAVERLIHIAYKVEHWLYLNYTNTCPFCGVLKKYKCSEECLRQHLEDAKNAHNKEMEREQ